jgi:hypothetical protein
MQRTMCIVVPMARVASSFTTYKRMSRRIVCSQVMDLGSQKTIKDALLMLLKLGLLHIDFYIYSSLRA